MQSSTGGTFSSKSVVYDDGKKLKLEIWDSAGQERYRALTSIFYKDSNAAVMVYDITRNETFEELKKYWSIKLKENLSSHIILAIASNKSDLVEQETLDEEEARNLEKN